MNVFDLFSGIGGFSLGFTRAGMRTVAFCEIDPFCRGILAKHWPNVPIFEDVRTLHAKDITEPIDLVCAGYPCQPFSVAGKRQGAADDRHLWPEVVRLLREFGADRPTWCVFENVVGHVSMGLDQVLADLEAEGYTAWPLIIPACAVNAPHRRDRVWIIANSRHKGFYKRRRTDDVKGYRDRSGNVVTDGLQKGGLSEREVVADTDAKHGDFSGLRAGKIPQQREAGIQQNIIADTEGEQARGVFQSWFSTNPESGCDWRGPTEEWTTQPPVCGRNDGVPGRVARLKALGNSVVPQIPELIGRAILEYAGG